MKIDDKHVQGIYKYDSQASYDRGDIVVLSNKLYVCLTNNTNPGINPENSKDFFRPYFGFEAINSYEDYLKEDSSGKFLTTNALESILSHYFSGINKRGVIVGPSIDVDTIGRLDKIIKDPNQNNALYTVDPEVIKNILKLDSNALYVNSISRRNWDKLILRQFTYMAEDKLVRVQELIDHTYGDTFFRSLVKPKNSEWKETGGMEITPWKINYKTIHPKTTQDYFILRDILMGMVSYSKTRELSANKSAEDRFCYSSLSPNSDDSTSYLCIKDVSRIPSGSSGVVFPKEALLKYNNLGKRVDVSNFSDPGILPFVVTISTKYVSADGRTYIQTFNVDLTKLSETDTTFKSSPSDITPPILLKYLNSDRNIIVVNTGGSGSLVEVVFKNRLPV